MSPKKRKKAKIAYEEARPADRKGQNKGLFSSWRFWVSALLGLFAFYALHPLIFSGDKEEQIYYENDEPVMIDIRPEEELTTSAPEPKEGVKPVVEERQPEESEQITKEKTPNSSDDIAYLIETLSNSEDMEYVMVEQSEEAQDVHDEKSYQLYEEELPDNIIDEHQEQDVPSTVHYQQKNIKEIDVKVLPRPHHETEKLIAVVIDDMGVNVRRTRDIISLEAPLTSSFLTYGPHLEQQIEAARAAGHEIMVHVPMQPHKDLYTAPDGLTVDMTDEELTKNFEIMLTKFEGVKGVNNHMGSKLTEDMKRMSAVMEILKEKGLFFLDSKTSAKSKAEEAAEKAGIAYAHRHVFIDNNNDKAYILGQLAKAENVARKNGYAIAIGHPKTQTFAALKEWLPSLEQKGIVLMPLSKIVAILNP